MDCSITISNLLYTFVPPNMSLPEVIYNQGGVSHDEPLISQFSQFTVSQKYYWSRTRNWIVVVPDLGSNIKSEYNLVENPERYSQYVSKDQTNLGI